MAITACISVSSIVSSLPTFLCFYGHYTYVVNKQHNHDLVLVKTRFLCSTKKTVMTNDSSLTLPFATRNIPRAISVTFAQRTLAPF